MTDINDVEKADREPCRKVSFVKISFPSDSLSVKRLRVQFPERFDTGKGGLIDGYDNFFYPQTHDRPADLFNLARMIEHERVFADYAFSNALDPYPSDTLNSECAEAAGHAKNVLIKSYQDFKLADSPETAKFLLQQIEEQATQQAREPYGRSR